MKLSIVVPLYNKEKYIERCLDSLLAQDLPSSEYEIIVVDDGSTDSSYSIASDYSEKHLNIKLFNQKNQGAGAARNKGLDLASGDYVYFLDADDYIASNVLNVLLTTGEKHQLEILGFKTIETVDEYLPESNTQEREDFSLEVMDGTGYIAKHGFRNEAWFSYFQFRQSQCLSDRH